MAAGTHQVTCITPDGSDRDQRIDAIGGVTDGKPWNVLIDDAIAGIESGKWKFWTTTPKGESVWIIVAERNRRKYLKTTADGVEPNNLLALNACPA